MSRDDRAPLVALGQLQFGDQDWCELIWWLIIFMMELYLDLNFRQLEVIT